MSWFPNQKHVSWIAKICISILKSGHIPHHVAFIMDGNRRFAIKNSINKSEGHLKGFEKLAEMLEWCRDLDITEVTVYAFSIENFKRSSEEVECLMELARQKFTKLLEEKELLEKHSVKVRVIGNLQLLPVDIQILIRDIMKLTEHNTKAVLNVCLAYTSRHEICEAMKLLIEGVKEGIITSSDITQELLEYCLFTEGSHPDLLVRTSGEVRLSDFLLWQSSYSVLSFVKVLWPDFSIWHLFAGILQYQMNYDALQKVKNKVFNDRYTDVVDNIRSLSDISPSLSKDSSSLLQFKQFVRDRRTSYINNLGSRQIFIDQSFYSS